MDKIVQNGDYYEIPGEESQNISDLQKIRSEMPSQQQDNIVQQKIKAKDAYNNINSQQGQYFSVYGRNPRNIDGVKETVFERLTRLKLELEEFRQDLNLISERNKEVKNEVAEDDLSLLEEIEILQKEFTEISSQEILKSLGGGEQILSKYSLESNLTLLKRDMQNEVSQNLIKQLGQKSQNLQNESKLGENQECPRLELLMKSESKLNSQQNEKIVELEKRISHIEAVLGADKINQWDGTTIIQKFDSMKTTFDLMDENKIRDIQQVVNRITQDLDQAQEKKNNSNPNNLRPEENKKIEDLWNRMHKVQGVADELPIIVKRLETLKSIHEESAGFLLELTGLVNLHGKVCTQLDKNQTLISQNTINFENNITTVLSNLQSLEERINKISNK